MKKSHVEGLLDVSNLAYFLRVGFIIKGEYGSALLATAQHFSVAIRDFQD